MLDILKRLLFFLFCLAITVGIFYGIGWFLSGGIVNPLKWCLFGKIVFVILVLLNIRYGLKEAFEI